MVQLNALRRWLLLASAVTLLSAGLALGVQRSEANERIISDPSDQLALFGYDPVAYLADGEARRGLPAFETIYAGLVWRFANEGNLQAFVDDPEYFIPAYGGHSAYMMAQGAITAGHPDIWIRLGGRVLFFHTAAARYAFLLEAEALLTRADLEWPNLRDTLSP